MDIDELLSSARDTLTVKRVFGEPIERDGTLIIPVAVVAGGGGGGEAGGGPDGTGDGGGGFGVWARPLGVYVVRDGRADFRPAIDLLTVALAATILVPRLLRALTRRRR